MPELDLDPGSYRERKPKGWRWRLPWSHPEDSKLHLAVLVLVLCALFWVFANRLELTPELLFGGAAALGAVAGIMFAAMFRD